MLPAFSELQAMGIQLFLASSLSGVAVSRFLERFPVRDFFSGIWDRSTAGGVKAARWPKPSGPPHCNPIM